MARLWQSGFELNSLTAGVEFTSITGAPTIDATTFRTGTYALRAHPTATTASISYTFLASGGSTNNIYVRTYLYIASAPSATSARVIQTRDAAAGVNVGALSVTSTRTIQLIDAGNGTQVGSDSSALSLNTWYRLELLYNYSATTGTLTGYIDGVQFATGTMVNNANHNPSQISIGAVTTTTADLYFDDVAINDSTGSFQNSLPGAGGIVHAKPSGTGDSNGFTTAVGGTAGAANNYTRVSETTPDDATSYNEIALTIANRGVADLFTVTVPTIASGDTINTVLVGTRHANGAATANGLYELLIEKSSGGTLTASAATAPNAIVWRTNATNISATANYLITTYQDPTSTNWTQSTLATSQIGYRISATSNSANTVRVSTLFESIDFTPASGVLTVSTSDSSTITESVGRLISSFVSTSDSTTVSENKNATLVDNVTVSDSTTLSENVQVALTSNINVSDSTTLSESVNVGLNLSVSVSDSTTLTDTPIIGFVGPISVSDTVTSTESILIQDQEGIAVLDSTTTSESITVAIPLTTRAVEGVGLTDSPILTLVDLISVSDSTTLTENVNVSIAATGALSVSVSDSVTLSEAVSLVIPVSITVSDSTVLTESLKALLESIIRVSDNSTVSESTNQLLQSFVNVSDTSTVSDSPNVTIATAGVISINVSDSVSASESAKAVVSDPQINVSDSATLSESIQRLLTTNLIVSDGTVVSDSRRNLIKNPSFEVDVSNWSTDGVSFTRDTINTSIGTGSAKFVSDGTFNQAHQTGTSIPVSPGVTYSVQARVTTTSAHTLNAGGSNQTNAIIYAYWQNLAGSSFAQGQFTGAVVDLATIRTNYLLSGTFTAPAGAVSMTFFIYQYGVGTAWWDAIMLEAAPSPTTYLDGSVAGSGWEGTANASISSTPVGYEQVTIVTPATDINVSVSDSTSVKDSFGNALQFYPGNPTNNNGNRSPGDVTISGGTAITAALTNQLTVAIWAKLYTNNFSNTGGSFLVAKRGPSGSFRDFSLETTNTSLQMVVNNVSNVVVSPSYPLSSFNYRDWFLAVGTYDGANVTLYVNGVQVVRAAQTGNIQNLDNQLRLGTLDGTSGPVYGELDDFRLWNTALTSTEVTALYNNSLTPQPSSLLIEYLLDENTGTTVNDTSGNGHTGTIENSAGWITDYTPYGGKVYIEGTLNLIDHVLIRENILASIYYPAVTSDSVTISESVTVFITSVNAIASDTTTITESVRVSPDIGVAVNDSIATADSVQTSTSLAVVASDAVTISELIVRDTSVALAVTDQASTSDSVGLAVTPLYINVSDHATVTENSTVSISGGGVVQYPNMLAIDLGGGLSKVLRSGVSRLAFSAGAPSGAPNGYLVVFDYINNKLYVYNKNSATWKSVTLT